MTIKALQAAAQSHFLDVFGSLYDGKDTIVLLGPHEPGYWTHIKASSEWNDGKPDPIDRWSTKIVTKLALDFGGEAQFPFGGPPYEPFFTWATQSGSAWQSPVSLLVHHVAGLMVSYRGAIRVRGHWDIPAPPENPCNSCATKPCLTASPSGSLTGDGYDVPKCHSFLDTEAGLENLSYGCNVRRSCPVSQSYGRLAEHSAYHMSIFHK
jgi:hypothetical protein